MARGEATTTGEQRITLEVSEAEAGVRLDRFLAVRLPELSRMRVQALIRGGAVADRGGTLGEAGRRVKPGERITLLIPAPEEPVPQGEPLPLSIVYEDADLIVVDKPAGLVVHPAPGHRGGTLVNALIAHCGDSLSGIGGVKRPGIVHRLDKDTSGLLVVAKTDAAHRGLSEQFSAHGADGRLTRTYLALVWGAPLRARGSIDAPLARSATNRTKIAVSRNGGRRAVTHYERVSEFRGRDGKVHAALLRLHLETGRTHQIRVHLAHAGMPVMGDPVYASSRKSSRNVLTEEARVALDALGRQALHAAELGFEHPATGDRMRFASPLPADMQRLLGALGNA